MSTDASAILHQLFDALEPVAEPVAARLGSQHWLVFATTTPPMVSVFVAGRDGEALDGGAVAFTPDIGTAIAIFLTEGLQTLDDETRSLVAEASNARRASIAMFADPLQGRARAWLVPTGGKIGQGVALFELRERPGQIH